MRKALGFLCLFFFLLLFFHTNWAGATDLKEVISHLREKQNSIRDLEAQLIQEKKGREGTSPVIMKGVIKIKKPNKLRIDVSPPYESITVLNEDLLLIYFPDEKMAQRIKVSQRPDLSRWLRFLQNPVKEIEEKGVLEGEKDGQVIIRLNPEGEFDFFKSLRLWIDTKDWLLVKTELTEKTEEVTITSFKQIRLNTGIKDKEFQLKLPPDVEVTDLIPRKE